MGDNKLQKTRDIVTKSATRDSKSSTKRTVSWIPQTTLATRTDASDSTCNGRCSSSSDPLPNLPYAPLPQQYNAPSPELKPPGSDQKQSHSSCSLTRDGRTVLFAAGDRDDLVLEERRHDLWRAHILVRDLPSAIEARLEELFVVNIALGSPNAPLRLAFFNQQRARE